MNNENTVFKKIHEKYRSTSKAKLNLLNLKRMKEIELSLGKELSKLSSSQINTVFEVKGSDLLYQEKITLGTKTKLFNSKAKHGCKKYNDSLILELSELCPEILVKYLQLIDMELLVAVVKHKKRAKKGKHIKNRK